MKIAVLPGDGIGPEIVAQSVKVLEALKRRNLPLEMQEGIIGGAAYDRGGDPLPPETWELARSADAILFGAAGTYEYDLLTPGKRPGDALLKLRRELGLFANFRPAICYPELIGASTLKREVVEGLDLMIIRELNGDIYFGAPRGIAVENGERVGTNTMRYAESEVERIAHVAFRTAKARRRKLCSVDKANVLETSALWREVMTRIGKEYPEVELTHLYVDAAAMNLVRSPKSFDVIVAGNMFGDIISDEAAMLTGSIGMLPSASLGTGTQGLYEPIHGSAPDIAGKDVANPIAQIMSAAMMLRMSFQQDDAASRIEAAVRAVLAEGYRTPDIAEPGARTIGTQEMGDRIAAAIG
jgi:3-isopropylmalate dehydrogenase